MQYDKIAAEIEQVEGIVAHGLLLDAADAVIIADQQQGVKVVECDRQKQAAAAASSSS